MEYNKRPMAQNVFPDAGQQPQDRRQDKRCSELHTGNRRWSGLREDEESGALQLQVNGADAQRAHGVKVMSGY